MADNSIYSALQISERIQLLRLYLGLSQRDFAQYIGVSPSQLNDWESGRKKLSLNGAIKIYEKTGADLNWLYFAKTDSLPHKMAIGLEAKALAK